MLRGIVLPQRCNVYMYDAVNVAGGDTFEMYAFLERLNIKVKGHLVLKRLGKLPGCFPPTPSLTDTLIHCFLCVPKLKE